MQFHRKALLFVCLLFCVIASTIATAANADYKIGVLLPLQGSMATWGKSALDGLQLANERISEGNDTANHRKIELVVEDFGDFDLKRAASAAQKLVTIDKVNLIFTSFTEDTEVVWKIAAAHHIPVVAIAAGGEDVTKDRPNVFRISPSDTSLMQAALDYVTSSGTQQPCILNQEIAYFESMAKYLQRILKNVQQIGYSPNESDFRSGLAKLKQSGCNALFALVLPNAMVPLLQQMHAIKFSPLVIGPPATGDPIVFSAPNLLTEGVIFPRFVEPSPSFIELFKSKFGKEPGIMADYAYDALMLVAKVIGDKASSSTELISGLSKIKDYQGASGQIDLSDGRSRSARTIDLWIIQDGRAHTLERKAQNHPERGGVSN